MRRLLCIAAFLVVAASCGGSSDARCVAVSDEVVDVYQELVSAIDDLELGSGTSSSEGFVLPAEADLERRAEELQRAADAAGCGDDEMRQLISERIIRLEARTVYGQALLDEIRRQGLFFE